MKAIHQLVAGFASGDAISNEARVLRALFRSWGYESEIFSEPRCISPVLRQDAHDIAQLAAAARTDDLALLHLSIGSVVNDLFAALPCRRTMIYHNMTPATYFQGINESISRDLVQGRKQARALAGAASVVMADSHYNADELAALGYGAVQVLPLLLDFSRIRARPDRGILRTFNDGKANILFVGRCVPNKRIEDILSAFHYFQKCVEPDSRLILVGSHAGLEKYHMLLKAMAHDLGLRNVQFTGSVSQEVLSACYEAADLFLCMSEHEGFCIPLIESMTYDVPILAYAAAAVPETLGGAGVLFQEKRWDLISEMMGHLHRNPDLRKAVLVKQRQRLAGYESLNLEDELRNCLASLLP
ncbi:MAG: glycosyltransferase [Verrucomicrobia bacterium]|nr:glycosyltransferase [Verrucomicrobiota bacterium]MBU4290883.1 glycosyltransferase [Verrucomicrobiota bacterium]MBU4429684.1 glycosyltransferase [Verrucomicrobiota bacterium]MBU4497823.1 glycosyltransferase [Verrucomicrobiota bacterium]MCG2680632.1 glycosyltransferase [Kiritimatiellia bacterium]